MKLLTGRDVAEKIEKEEILPNLQKIKTNQPNLAIILVGRDPDSKIYVHEKEKAGKRLGIEVSIYKFDQDSSFEQIKNTIEFLNHDQEINGIIIQLPLPENLKSLTEKLLNLIDSKKDVDALSSLSSKSALSAVPSFVELKSVYLAKQLFLPPTATASLEVVDFYQIALKNVLLIGRGILVGAPIANILNQLTVNYQVVHSHTLEADRQKLLKKADLIIAGSSSPKPIFGVNDIKSDAAVIDCAADFDHNNIDNWSGSLTPRVGGIGPVTVACLMRNVVYARIWQDSTDANLRIYTNMANVSN